MANTKNRKNAPNNSRKKFKTKKPHNPPDRMKFDLGITKDHLVSKSGTIKRKSKDHLKLLDDILKTELMIGVNTSANKPSISKPVNESVNNNNYDKLDKLENVTKTVNNNKTNNSTKDKSKRRSKKSPPKLIPIKEFLKKSKKSVRDVTKIVKESAKDKHFKGKDDKETSRVKRLPKENKQSKQKDSKVKQSNLDSEIMKKPTAALTYKFVCDYCKKTFEDKSHLRKHIYKHENKKPFSCEFCHRRFPRRCNLEVHIVKKHFDQTESREKFICDLCNKPFLLKANLSLHLSSHTNGILFYKCAFCDSKFSNHFYLTAHEKRHLYHVKKYKCSLCDKKYDVRARLAIHVKRHLNIKDFICHYCGKEFLRPHSIRRHVEICHSGFRIQCPICHKKLKGHLSEHLRTHENAKPHKCDICGQRFTQSTQLTVHRRSHTGLRPYACRICDKRFTHSNAMLQHFRRHTGEKPFKCAMCPVGFSQLPHMKAHMKKIHGKSEAYKCNKCDEFFRLKKLLDTHMKTCMDGDKILSEKQKMELSIEAPELDSVMNLSRMRFLLALLLKMVANKSKLKSLVIVRQKSLWRLQQKLLVFFFWFNKRLIDDLLIDSLEAMGHTPCIDESMTPLKRLKINIDTLLIATVPEEEMKKFREEKKTTEELLELLTDDKTSCAKIL